jgi:hypothetical protein
VPGGAVETDSATLRLNYRRDDGQPEAAAAVRRGAVYETLEDPRLQVRGNARTVVAHCERDRPRAAGVEPNRHGAAGGCVRARVGEQVRQRLVQRVLVASDRHRLVGQLEPPLVRGARHLGVAHGVERDPSQVDRLAVERTAGVEPREQKQVLEERAHSVGLGNDALERGLDFGGLLRIGALRVLGVAANDRDRSAQLVARVGDETAQFLLAGMAFAQCSLDVLEHVVERLGDLAHLRAGSGIVDAIRDRHLAAREWQVGHLQCGRCDAVQRPQ